MPDDDLPQAPDGAAPAADPHPPGGAAGSQSSGAGAPAQGMDPQAKRALIIVAVVVGVAIALFLLLAVGMLMLRMFSDQLREKQQELKEQEYEQQLEFAKKEAEQECGDVCADALSNGCDLQSEALFCMHKVALDLNADGVIDDGTYSHEYTLGACEEHVYCPLFGTCSECGRSLDFATCYEVVCEYFTGQGIEGQELDRMLSIALAFGACTPGQRPWNAAIEKLDLATCELT